MPSVSTNVKARVDNAEETSTSKPDFESVTPIREVSCLVHTMGLAYVFLSKQCYWLELTFPIAIRNVVWMTGHVVCYFRLLFLCISVAGAVGSETPVFNLPSRTLCFWFFDLMNLLASLIRWCNSHEYCMWTLPLEVSLCRILVRSC